MWADVCVQYEDVADKDDLMGVEDTAKKGIFKLTVCVHVHGCSSALIM